MLRSVASTASLVAVALALTACAGGPQSPEPDPTTPAAAPGATTESSEGTLTIAQNDDYTLVGTFVTGSSLIQFASKMTDDGISTVELTVNGATFDVTSDLQEFTTNEDGHGNTLFKEDRDSLLQMEKALDAKGEKGRTWERLFKVVSAHAGAPVGHTFLKLAISPKGIDVARDGSGRPSGTVSDEGITYQCSGYYGYHLYNSWDWVWYEHDSVNGSISYTNEGATNYTSPNSAHWRLQAWYPAGCRLGDWYGRGSCEGRCGAGCPRTYNFYFTKDCGDHDTCLDVHPNNGSTSSSGDCGWEYSDAYGDWLNGSSSTYQYWDCGSVSSSCPENGNAVDPGQ